MMLNYLTTDYTINFPTTWFTADKMAEFWQYVKWFTKFNMPLIMIVVALLLAGMFGETIVELINQARHGKRRDDDDDDIDIEYY